MELIRRNSFFGSLVISYKELFPEGIDERIGVSKEHITKIGKRVSHTKENIYGWEENIISSQIDFNKPILLCLGGSGIDENKLANGIAKLSQELIGRKNINDKEVQILSAVYPKDVQMLGEERKQFKLGQKRNRVDYIYAVYDTIFLPILFSNYQKQHALFEISRNFPGVSLNIEGKSVSIPQAIQDLKIEGFDSIKKKLRNITILSHCHGSFVACELINYLREDLETLQFSNNKINELLGEITNIMLSPRDGVQRIEGPLNIGFTLASDNLEGGITEQIRKGKNTSVSDFTDKLLSNKIKGSDTFYFKYGSLYNFWDTDKFGADFRFVKDYDEDGMSYSPSDMIYREVFMGNHFHLFENYCSITGKYDEEGIGTISKNEIGRNFTKIIAKTLQNAISLSALGAKRTLKEVISNETELGFRQGTDSENPHFKNVKFDGNLEDFAHTYELKIANKVKNIPIDTQNQR
ncbi:MAG: hypothetical protein K6F04_03605 [bacterium]|nr:hypothetical protein [bacterium]